MGRPAQSCPALQASPRGDTGPARIIHGRTIHLLLDASQQAPISRLARAAIGPEPLALETIRRPGEASEAQLVQCPRQRLRKAGIERPAEVLSSPSPSASNTTRAAVLARRQASRERPAPASRTAAAGPRAPSGDPRQPRCSGPRAIERAKSSAAPRDAPTMTTSVEEFDSGGNPRRRSPCRRGRCRDDAKHCEPGPLPESPNTARSLPQTRSSFAVRRLRERRTSNQNADGSVMTFSRSET